MALLAIMLILGTAGYIGLRSHKWNPGYGKKAHVMENYSRGNYENGQWLPMGQGYSQEKLPCAQKGFRMMNHRTWHRRHRYKGAELPFLVLIALGAYLIYLKYMKKNAPLEILKERFARSEITKEQYEDMKKIVE